MIVHPRPVGATDDAGEGAPSSFYLAGCYLSCRDFVERFYPTRRGLDYAGSVNGGSKGGPRCFQFASFRLNRGDLAQRRRSSPFLPNAVRSINSVRKMVGPGLTDCDLAEFGCTTPFVVARETAVAEVVDSGSGRVSDRVYDVIDCCIPFS